MFTFLLPKFALLLLVPLVFWLLLPISNSTNAESEILFPYLERLNNAFLNIRLSGKKSIKLLATLLSLLWISLVFSIMQPQWLDNVEYDQQKGYDIMLAVDTSWSMHALDFATKENPRLNRLEITKQVVGKFTTQRKGDRVGLIVFGEYAYLHSPMSFDTLAISKMLNNLQPGIAGGSTAIGDAIGIAAREIRSKDKSKILILLTDGADNASTIPPIEAANIAKNYGIRIYTVGIGGNGLVPMPDEFGRVNMANMGSTDEKLLEKIAEITEGKSFKATDSSALEKIYQEINELEKIEIDSLEYKTRQPLYRYPLGFACIIFLLLCLMPLFKGGKYGV